MPSFPSSTLRVDLDAYAHNLRYVRERIPADCAVIAVVKADAYGLGAAPIARRAIQEGVLMLAVATIDEGISLRQQGIEAPILVLIQPPHEALGATIEFRLRLTISDVATAERLGDAARKQKRVAQVHCEIDTGMGRQGFLAETAVADVLAITRVSNVDIEGISTHFPSADAANDQFTVNQVKIFRQLLKQLEKQGVPYEIAHAANSAGIVNFPGASLNAVRAGLVTFGVWPGDTPPPEEPLRTVAQWTSRIVLVKEIPGGASVGYSRTYRAPSRMVAAVAPVGYADGYPLALSNNAEVLIRSVRCPVRGRVSMDQIVVDVTEVPGVSAGDDVILLGGSGGKRITVEELATRAQTIPYEILTGIGQRVTRTYAP